MRSSEHTERAISLLETETDPKFKASPRDNCLVIPTVVVGLQGLAGPGCVSPPVKSVGAQKSGTR